MHRREFLQQAAVAIPLVNAISFKIKRRDKPESEYTLEFKQDALEDMSTIIISSLFARAKQHGYNPFGLFQQIGIYEDPYILRRDRVGWFGYVDYSNKEDSIVGASVDVKFDTILKRPKDKYSSNDKEWINELALMNSKRIQARLYYALIDKSSEYRQELSDDELQALVDKYNIV